MENEMTAKEFYEQQSRCYGRIVAGEWRMWREDIYKKDSGKDMGSFRHSFEWDDGDLDKLALDFTEHAKSWQAIGYVLIGGFVSHEEAEAEVAHAQSKLAALETE